MHDLKSERFRLSPQQKHIWLVQQDTQQFLYRTQCVVRLSGALDPARLAAALSVIIDRHESLRTRLEQVPGMRLPVQVIDSASAPVLEQRTVDTDQSSDAERAAIVQGIRQELAERPDQETSLQAVLVRGGEHRHWLVLSMPSLNGDSITLYNLTHELATVYGAGQATVELDDVAQYADVAEWQNELLESADTETERAFWQSQDLNDLLEAPTLFGQPIGSIGDFVPATCAVDLDTTQRQALVDLASDWQITPAALLLAGWQVVLWRLSDHRQRLIGVACDGRSYQELEQPLGLFERYLPLSLALDPATPFAAHAQRVQQDLNSLIQSQEYFSWDQVLLDRSQHPSEPFIPLCFALYMLPDPETGAGLTFEIDTIQTCTDRFSLKLVALQRGANLTLELHYDTQAVAAADAHGLAEACSTLFTAVIAAPAVPVGRAQVLSASAYHRLIKDFNRTEQPYPAVPGVHELVDLQAVRSPEAVAVVYGDTAISYAELCQRSNQVAHYLRRLGVGPDVCVGLCLHRSLEMVIGLLGILKAGGAYVPLDPAYPQERLRFMIADARVPVLLTHTELADALAEHSAAVVCIDRDWQAIAQELDTPLVTTLTPDNLAYVIYTSGSTGYPKGVMVHHRGVVNYVSWAITAYDLAQGRGTLVHSPLGFDLTVTSLLAPLCAGQQVTLLPAQAGVEALAQVMRENQDFSLIKLTPAHVTILNQLIPVEELAGRTRALIIGGEALAAEPLTVWRRHAPQTHLINEYGPTEAVVGCCTLTMQPGDPYHGAVPIGVPIGNMRLYVLDAYLDQAPVGVSGELYIGGIGVARGYRNRPDLTAERFIADPFSDVPGARLYRTGDLARYQRDGQLEYLGRIDQQVKLRGFRVELQEVESVLARHERVRDTVVVLREDALADAPGTQQLVGYVVFEPGGEAPLEADLQEFVGRYVPDYMIPSAISVLERFPLTSNGKVDRAALPAPTRTQRFVAPTSEDEEVLAGIWSRVLETAPVGVEDSFFALGGNSIRSIQVVAQAQERGLDFSVEEMFAHPTIRSLAQHLTTRKAAQHPALDRAPFTLISEADRALLPDGIEDAYPIAKLQGGMIFHNQYNPDKSLYHDIFSYQLRLPLDLTILQHVVTDLVQRHQVLRTSFDLTTFSEPLQLVHSTGCNLLTVTDIRTLPVEQQDETIGCWIAEEKQRGFDCAQLPLVRFQLHLRAANTIQFSLSFHHAAIDGWSDATMLTELFTDYVQRIKGQAQVINPPATLYRDFVVLERTAIESADARRFWDNALAGVTPMRLPRWPELPGFTRPGGTVVQPVPIAVDLSQRLKQLALELAVPVKNVLLTAHLRVIGLLTGQADVMTGIVSSGRPETVDGERVLGLFINSIPLRMSLHGSTWRELITRSFDTERESLPFRRYPTAELQRRHGGQRLSESLFYFTHYHIFQAFQQIADVELLDVLPFEVSSFPLVANFRIDPFTTEINLNLTCDGTILCQEQIQAIGSYYAATLNAMVDQPDARYDAAHLLSAHEQQQQLVAYNPVAHEPPGYQTIHQWIEAQARRTPEAIAVVAGPDHLSYRQLDEQANQLAYYLRERGIGSDDRVGLCMARSTELIVAILGVLKAGGAYVPLDPEYPAERLALIVEDARPALLLTQRHVADALASCRAEIVLVDDAEATLRQLPTQSPAGLARPDAAAYIIYTSGSTGRPKGVVVSHANLVHSTQARVLRYDQPPTGFLLLSSVAFDSSVAGIFWSLAQGARLVVPVERSQHELTGLATIIQREHISHTLCIPSLYALLLEHAGAEALGSLRSVIVAGEACPRDLVEQHHALLPHTTLFNEYGPTEGTVWSTVYNCGQLQPGLPVLIGEPIPYAAVYVLDEHLQLLPVGVSGELVIGGSSVARGYLDQPAQTAAAFVPDPFVPSTSSTAGSRMYRTGDRVRWLPDGSLEFLGRIDQQVKIRGFRVELGEIETLLRSHPGIQTAIVVARNDEHATRRLVAYIVVDGASELTDPATTMQAAT